MIRKQRIGTIIGITLLFLLSALPVNTKGMETDNVWDITLKGQGEAPFFQSSVEMDIALKAGSTKDDITIFINKQKWNGDWDYDQDAKIIFREEGEYNVHLIHKNGYEETRKIIVELTNPTPAKFEMGSYHAGTWTNQDILLKAYGAKSVSKISHYEYKMGEEEWRIMKDHQLQFTKNMNDTLLIRAVSNAGRVGEISKVEVRLWKSKPQVPEVICDQKSFGGWYSKIPKFSYQMEVQDGPITHVYMQLTDLETKQTQTKIDGVLDIRQDGRYSIKIWTKDEAGNRSQKMNHIICLVDTKKPEIFVEYQNTKNIYDTMKYQKALIKVRDINLAVTSLKISTSGRQSSAWVKKGEYYQTEVVFDRDGRHNLSINAEDLAGNTGSREEPSFQIDTKKPEIMIYGIRDGESYQKPVEMDIKVSDENLNSEQTRIYLNGKLWNKNKIKKDGYYTVEVKAQDLAGNKNTMTKRFVVNQKGIEIHFLQNSLKGRNISTRNFRPGFRIRSLEPVQITGFWINGQKTAYYWKKDEVYVKDPIMDNGKCTVKLEVKDAAGNRSTSDEITFFYDTKNPVIKMKGLDKNMECPYGKEISISLEDSKDYWKEIKLDGQNIQHSGNKISFVNLKPGMHMLELEAEDLAGNKAKKKIKFQITKILPEPVKKMIRQKVENKQTIKQKQKISKSSVWFMAGIILVTAYVGVLCKKHSKL